jgi:hypothetical protein
MGAAAFVAKKFLEDGVDVQHKEKAIHIHFRPGIFGISEFRHAGTDT